MLADAGVENKNDAVDALISSGLLKRVLAQTEIRFSNSMIEAWWRSLKHQWLFLHPLDSMAKVGSLVAFYVAEHNSRLPHSAFRGLTPTRGTSERVPPSPTNSPKRVGPLAMRASPQIVRDGASSAFDPRSSNRTERRVRQHEPGVRGLKGANAPDASAPPVTNAMTERRATRRRLLHHHAPAVEYSMEISRMSW